jgi:hypothetical protein
MSTKDLFIREILRQQDKIHKSKNRKRTNQFWTESFLFRITLLINY